jgi:fibro-slime domain-containing protein
VFGFEGDDDLWVFVNDQLGIDLGGVHGPLSGQIDMDALAGQLGLQIGGMYDLDFFFAERHTTQSNFEITTTISCFDPQ